MTRKAISTNPAVIVCDVCGRTLLRGENADTFLHGGRRRAVCELCTQRAVHEGWIREGLDDVVVRGRQARARPRTLLGRLRSRREQGVQRDEDLTTRGFLAADEASDGAFQPEDEPELDPVDFAEFGFASSSRPGPPEPLPAPLPVPDTGLHADRSVHGVPTNAELKVARAIEVFNGGQHPRTVAGVSRSLGPPLVSARPSPTEGSVVTIVVAWELSWYRFEVDLGDEAAGVRVAAQGSELGELDAVDHEPNAAADEAGHLHAVPG